MSEATSPTPPPSEAIRGSLQDPKGTKLAMTGALLLLAPLFGADLAIDDFMSKLGKMGASDAGGLNAESRELLVNSALIYGIGGVGCVLLGIAVFVQRCSASWVKWLFWLSLLPAMIGVAMLVILFKGAFAN